MRPGIAGRALFFVVPLLASAALTTGPVAQALPAVKVGRPLVSTGGATKVRGTSATLTGTVNPHGAPTSYFFQFGPTLAYGKQAVTANLPAGSLKVKVGQAVTGLLAGYHYRLVATNGQGPPFGTTFGKDRTVGVKSTSKAKFTFPKSTEATVFGSTYVLSGTISGAGNANRSLALQSSPFPFLAPFATIGLPVQTDALGRFTFHVPKLSTSTQFRVSTLDPRPTYSPIVSRQVAVRVTLKVRSTGHRGLVRLYGTVTPAKVGARLSFQLSKPIRPGKSEKETKFATQFSTVVKRGTKTVSRFSAIETVRRGGTYRAYAVVPGKGALVSGASPTVTLHAAPTSTGTHKQTH
jgi:hypothetical protein